MGFEMANNEVRFVTWQWGSEKIFFLLKENNIQN